MSPSSNRRQRWALLAVVALLVAIGRFFLRPSSSKQERTAGGTDHAATTDPKSRLRIPPRPPVAQNVQPGADHATRSSQVLPAAMQKALDDNPHLAQYYRLEQKVLPSAEERNTLRGMFADQDLIQTIKEDLLSPESTYSKEVEAKRMVAVEFLTDAVSWADNPAMGTVMDAIEGVVFAENIAADAPEDLAQSLAGDKMELYTQMLHRSPARAALLADHARGKSVEPFLTYSKDWYDRNMRGMKADERH